MKALSRTAAVLLCLATFASGAEVLSVEDVTSDFRLFITVWEGEIDIRPATDSMVSVDVNCEQDDGGAPQVNARGLRVISSDQSMPELRKSDDKVTFVAREAAGRCQIAVTAPASVRTQARINDTGSIMVSNWRAMVTAWSAGGDVTLRDQQAPFSVTAMNGDANIDYRGETLHADSAATAANGIVALSIAGEPPMTLRTQARWGEVSTDLDTRFSREQIGDASWSVASLAGGGPVVTLRNLNSDIVITKGEPESK